VDGVTTLPFLDLTRRLAHLQPLVQERLSAVLADGRLILGPAVARFEAAFAAYCGVRHAVGVGSGTDAIALALDALGIGDGDEVITAANTCVPTVAAIRLTGATPVLIDAHPQDWTLDPEGLPGAYTERTRAIVPVHLYGRPADMVAIRRFADNHGLFVVEDAAQAHGAAVGGIRAGALGDAAAFSFYPTKNLGGLGDGGMVVTDDDGVAEKVRRRRNYGLVDERALSPGRCSRLDEVQAAVLAVALPGLDAGNVRRRAIAERYLDSVPNAALTQREDPVHRSAWHLFVIAIERREGFRQQMARRGVETRVHYPYAIHQHPAFASVIRQAGSLRCSEQLARTVVSLPLYPELSDREVDRIVSATIASLDVVGSR
jgi:dTDP-3-amino-3,4,6-trideoxy-alpha-D-glucose transaminase